MKKFAVCVALCLCLVMSSFAQTVDNLPTWIKNSRIIHSELAFGSSKTIGDLYGKKPQDMAITTVKYSDTEMHHNQYGGYRGILSAKNGSYL